MIGKRITQARPADDKPWVGSCDISAASTSHNGGACGAVSQVRVRDEDSCFSGGRSTLNLLLVLPRPCMATTPSRQFEWGQGCWDLVHIGEAKWNTCLFSQRVCQRAYQFGKMLAGYPLPSNVKRASHNACEGSPITSLAPVDCCRGVQLRLLFVVIAVVTASTKVFCFPSMFFLIEWPQGIVALLFADCLQYLRYSN